MVVTNVYVCKYMDFGTFGTKMLPIINHRKVLLIFTKYYLAFVLRSHIKAIFIFKRNYTEFSRLKSYLFFIVSLYLFVLKNGC